jgi:competence protein ComEC
MFSKHKYLLSVFALFLFLINVYLFHLDWQNSHRNLTFAMLDVGQGDGLFVESPTGTQVLFDAGPPHSILGPLQKIISPFDKTIDAVVITNPDVDHIGGLLDILKNYKVGMIFESGTLTDSKTYQNLRAEMARQNIPDILIKKGMKLSLGGGVIINILFPDRDVSEWATNDGSIMARLTYGKTSIMLTGDAPVKTEQIVLSENSPTEIISAILKIGHHGSRTSSSESFVKAISPSYALISDGKNNKYGHPHQETLDTLAKFGAQILRTDSLGTIIFNCDRIDPCEIKK